MRRSLHIILLVAFAFLLSFALQRLFFADLRDGFNTIIGQAAISYTLAYLTVASPLLLAVVFLHGAGNFFSEIGLSSSIPRALIFALLCTLPMLIGYASVFELDQELTFNRIFGGAIMAAFMEELLYRGILFGQLFRHTRLGFIPAILFGALIFAAAHLYQSQDPGTLVGIFLTTFMGAVLFAWAYVEWKDNLWVPIFLHFFMNLFWMLFSVSDNAFGGTYANVFRGITIALIILLTILYKRRKGLKMAVNRQTIWMKSSI